MRQSTILIVGLDGAGSECVKNLVLAGIGHMTLLEHRKVDQNIVDTHFYVTSSHIGESVGIFTPEHELLLFPPFKKKTKQTLEDDYYKEFDCIVLNNQPRSLQLRVNGICRRNKNKEVGFFSSRSVGHIGYLLCDIGDTYAFTEKRNEKDKKILNWYSLESIYNCPRHVMQASYKKSIEYYLDYWYVLTVLEKFEDELLKTFNHSNTDYFTEIKHKFCLATYQSTFEAVETQTNNCPQFRADKTKTQNSCHQLLAQIRNLWHVSVCPLNSMSGGFLANFVMSFIQRKEQPLRNVLLFDMWKCEAISGLFYDDKARASSASIDHKSDAVVDVLSDSDNDDAQARPSDEQKVDHDVNIQDVRHDDDNVDMILLD
ncbi:hypothetical protein RFI_13109 [Reticulomyxa filosa]|uniref:Ubiquitin-like 1-activating enzyme E1A n=1 Tax=Reticulomyxa filosa TaxID=46433 RepID=X6NE79_RETFI|nr:hypothetical protein RFI_13109 [Reticulomyxa filosa]|eukprot:ETO24049.1 hypothetical protein RFI_13109 [Reticulomyxa filosa]